MHPIYAFLLLQACVPRCGVTGDSSVLQPPGDTGDSVAPEETGDSDHTGDSGDTDLEDPVPDYGIEGAWTPGILDGVATNQGGRDMDVDVWYPSLDGDGAAHLYGWDSWGFYGSALEEVAPDCAEPRPVMVHSHGNGSIRWEMFWLPEFAATHGWLVVAADHPGNTFVDGSTDYAALLTQRPTDVRAAYDWLLAQVESPEHPLHGCVDPAAGYVVSGYSFGGYTAYVTAGASTAVGWEGLVDERVTAVVTYAPWDAHALFGGTADIPVPVLTLGGDRDATVGTDYRDLHGSVTALPRVMGAFANAGHYSFTPIYCSSPGDGCGDDFIEAELFTNAVGTAVLAFLGHLRGQEGALEQLPEVAGELEWEIVLDGGAP